MVREGEADRGERERGERGASVVRQTGERTREVKNELVCEEEMVRQTGQRTREVKEERVQERG